MHFSEQVVVVTGAGRGIGQAIASAFAAAGSAVIVNDIDGAAAAQAATAIRGAGHNALAIQADIADQGAVRAMFAQAEAHFGPVSTLINNAGYVFFDTFMAHTQEAWKRVLDVDLNGIFNCTQAAVPQMTKHGQGFIVSIASVHATRTLSTSSAYAAAKAAVVGLTRSLALELGPQNIRINCVSPGAIETDALRSYFDSMPPDKRERERQHMLDWQPLGRFGRPADIASLVMFLCGPGAEFIHGTEIIADGGTLARLF
jgi:NAD(P)-dependent dehydrogenase (short-subunit alcohol dehydrogenase family)